MRIYAGIGSRRTPPGVLINMRRLAASLSDLGWRLATGGADGADTAFAAGAGPQRTTCYLPWPGYNGIEGANAVVLDHQARQAAERYAARFHPAWDRCGHGARKLHARNAAILLGPALDAPVDAVVCWTPGGQHAGGTATGIRIAEALGIPVLNLALLRPDAAIERLARIGA